jgi:hypothetical protein
MHRHDVQARGGGGAAERMHASCCCLGAEVEGLERGQAAQTPTSITLIQKRRLSDASAGRLLAAPHPSTRSRCSLP